MDVEGVSIFARGISAGGPEGTVFENVDLYVPSGSLSVVVGSGGTGRTSMLLALSGRMRLITGRLEVDRLALPRRARRVRRMVHPARLRPGYELEPKHRIAQAVAERRMTAKVTDDDVAWAFGLIDLTPDPRATVDELSPTDQLLFAIGLAAAAAPPAIVVDDVEAGLPWDARYRAWQALHALTRTGMTVIASSTDEPDADVDVDVIHMPAHPDEQEPEDEPERHGERTLVDGDFPGGAGDAEGGSTGDRGADDDRGGAR